MKKYLVHILGVLVVLGYMWVMVLGHDPLQPGIADKVLRFHVLANSDSEEDQAVKRAVRDEVGNYLKPLLENAGNLTETKEIVDANMETIVKIAQDTLAQNGFSYEVSAMVTETDFPEKSYGAYTFPQGEYEALQIVLGDGEGQNWWCVLYPNMCFRGSVYEVVEDEAGEALREVLSPWEYADVFESDEVELRFRLLDIFGL